MQGRIRLLSPGLLSKTLNGKSYLFYRSLHFAFSDDYLFQSLVGNLQEVRFGSQDTVQNWLVWSDASRHPNYTVKGLILLSECWEQVVNSEEQYVVDLLVISYFVDEKYIRKTPRTY